MSEDSADGFVMLDGKELTIYTNAEIGSVAKIGIKQSDGMKALVITKKSEQTIVFTYQG